jgi:hypothetical protein
MSTTLEKWLISEMEQRNKMSLDHLSVAKSCLKKKKLIKE